MSADIRIVTERLIMSPGKSPDAYEFASFLRRNRSRLEPWRPDWPDGFDSEHECRQAIERDHKELIAGQSLRVLLRLKSDPEGPIVGTCALFAIRKRKSAEIGFQIDGSLEGQGLAREAAEAMIDHGREHLGIKKLIAICLENNQRSIVLIERLGFVFCRALNDFLTINDRKFDHHQFELKVAK
ncbi:MAG: GNAT family protein [Planctomycetota bacterium]|nr:GNAT family protein [Planctomycetota bacterium]